MRGKEHDVHAVWRDPGITPACAGKSVHLIHQHKSHWGSPPRVRGKGCVYKLTVLATRITPACAGKRLRFLNGKSQAKDHPRVCGEKQVMSDEYSVRRGSPPRVRGKAGDVGRVQCAQRITPACAGKSCIMRLKVFLVQDHPRVCGEKDWKHCDAYIWVGSPPRVRGKGTGCPKHRLNPGITPACAGKRLKKAHKIKDFDPVPIRFHLVFRRFERWCSNLPTPDGNVPV